MKLLLTISVLVGATVGCGQDTTFSGRNQIQASNGQPKNPTQATGEKPSSNDDQAESRTKKNNGIGADSSIESLSTNQKIPGEGETSIPPASIQFPENSIPPASIQIPENPIAENIGGLQVLSAVDASEFVSSSGSMWATMVLQLTDEIPNLFPLIQILSFMIGDRQ